MSKFNIATQPAKADRVNRAGGEAFTETPELALVNLLLTCFLKDKHYETAESEQARLVQILGKVNPQFAAKAAIYARKEFGMRSITHLVAAHLAKTVKGEKWTRGFFRSVVKRPDDITEILAAYQAINGKLHPVPACLKKGLGDALSRIDEYGLAKYRGEGKAIKMVDAVNLLRPRGTEALSKLIKGTLGAADTWESAISAAGQEGSETTKSDEWARLIMERRLGYFALLRNIRNITQAVTDDAVLDEFQAQLMDPQAIRKSLVLPFRFLTAFKVFSAQASPVAGTAKILTALAIAIDVALGNVPELPGKTLVALDTSGSMLSNAVNQRPPGAKRYFDVTTEAQITASEIGALFAAALVKRCGADLLVFSDGARYVNLNPADSLLTMSQRIPFASGGTNFHAIFQSAARAYDRIVILSDMQGWIGYSSPAQDFRAYCSRYGCRPLLW